MINLKVSISKIVVTPNNPRQSFDEVKILEMGESILKHGQIHNAIVRPLPDGNYELVTGELRLRACIIVGLNEINVEVRELTDLQCDILRLAENVHRGDLSNTEKGNAFLRIWGLYDKFKYKKQLAEEIGVSYETIRSHWIPSSTKLSDEAKKCVVDDTFSDEHARCLFRYSKSTQNRLVKVLHTHNLTVFQFREFCKEYDKNPKQNLDALANKVRGIKMVQVPASTLTEEQKRKPKKKRKFRKGKQVTKGEIRKKYKTPRKARIYKPDFYAIKKLKHQQNIDELKEQIETLQAPKGVFEVIVIDPPWKYGTNYDAETRRVGSPYPEMSIEEIRKEPIIEKAAENCILWLWTTNAFMHEAFHLLEVWGFEPKTILTWVKDRMGLGVWLRGKTEHCILAVKGHPTIGLTNETTVLEGVAREHSRKPEEFYKLVETLCIGRKLDWFSPKPRKGWETYGTNERTT